MSFSLKQILSIRPLFLEPFFIPLNYLIVHAPDLYYYKTNF